MADKKGLVSKTGYRFTFMDEDKKAPVKSTPVQSNAPVSKTGYRFTYADKQPTGRSAAVSIPVAESKNTRKAIANNIPAIPTQTSGLAAILQAEADKKKSESISPFLKLGDGNSPYISDMTEAAGKVYGNQSIPTRKIIQTYDGQTIDAGEDENEIERMKTRLRAEMGLQKSADQLREEYDAKRAELSAATAVHPGVLPAGDRGNVHLRDTDETRRLQAEAQELRKQLDMASPSGWERMVLGAKSIGKTFAAVPRVIGEVIHQYGANTDDENANPVRTALQAEADRLLSDIQYLSRYAPNSEKTQTDITAKRERLETVMQEIKKTDVNMPVSMDSEGMRGMAQAKDAQERALRGMSDAGRFVGGTLISVGQNVALMPTAAITPAIPLAAMGAISGADKIYEASKSGAAPEQALLRGIVSGGIEALTEKIPLDNLLELAKGAGSQGARQVVKNILRQSGTEATEEAVSYVANLAADKIAKDPGASFSWAELLESAAGGALSGGIFGAGGSVFGAIRSRGAQPADTRVYPAAPWQQAQEQNQKPQGTLPISPVQTENSAKVRPAPVEFAIEEAAKTGSVSNAAAERILNSPAVVEAISKETGVNISSGMTKSQQRAAVKNASRTIIDRENAPQPTQEVESAATDELKDLIPEPQKQQAAQQADDRVFPFAPVQEKPVESFTGTEAMKRLGIKINGSAGDYHYIQSAIDGSKAAKQLEREIRKAERRISPTEAERTFAANIAKGVFSANDIPTTMRRGSVQELSEYYAARNAGDANAMQRKRAGIKQDLADVMESLFFNTEPKSTSSIMVMNERSPQRNMLKIFGDKMGKKVNALLFDPVDMNEQERTRFIIRMLDEVRTFKGKDGKARPLTGQESALVQQVIEGKATAEAVAGMEMSGAIQNAAESIRKGADSGDAAREWALGREEQKMAEKYARWLETKAALESSATDSVRIENAAKKYQEQYDKFYAAINDLRAAHGYEPIGFIPGYAPHLQPESATDTLGKFMQSLGILPDAMEIPTSIAGKTADYKPNARWNPYFQHRTGDQTEYDVVRGYQSYVTHMSDVLYHMDDIMRIREASNYFRRTYAPDEIKETLSWASELRYGSTAEKEAFLRGQNVIKAGDVHTPESIDAMMNEHVENLYQNIKQTTRYNDLVIWLDNFANILAGKQSYADRGIEHSIGRENLNRANRFISAFRRSQVGLNFASALNQTAQLPLITAEVPSKYVAGAMRDMANGSTKKENWAQKSGFMVTRKNIKWLAESRNDMLLRKMFTPLEAMDGALSTLATRAKYLQEIDAGKSEEQAIEAADIFAKEIMGSRAKGSMPLAFYSKGLISQMVHVFQVEAVNSWEHVSQDLPRDFREIEAKHGKQAAARALSGVIVKMLISAFIMNRIDEELYGGTPAPFDVLGLSANFIASGHGLTTNEWLRKVLDNGIEKISGERFFETRDEEPDEFDWGAAAEDTVFNLSNEIPFVRNASGLLGLGDQTLPIPNIPKVAKGVSDAAQNSGILSPEMLKAVFNVGAEILPGGKQLKKTAQGAEAVARGGRYKGYGDDARLQNIVEQSPANVARAMLFGDNVLPETREFYAAGGQGMTAKQTQIYRETVKAGAPSREAYDLIQTLLDIGREQQKRRDAGETEDLPSGWANAEKREAIFDSDLTPEQKALFDGLYFAGQQQKKVDYTDKERMQVSSLPAAQRYDAERAVKAGIPYADYNRYAEGLRKLEADTKDGKAVSGSKKKKQLEYINMQKGLTNTQKVILADTIGYRDDMAVLLGVLPEPKKK